MKTLLATTTLASALALPTVASAANFKAISLDCEGKPGCFLLVIEGKIEFNDSKKFEQIIAKNNVKMAVVGLNSPGGNVLEAYVIGKMIQEKGYTTYVPGFASCVSACAMIWTAGSTRQVEAKAKIGFHGAYTVDGRGRVVGGASSGNALVGSFYAHVGLSDMAILYMTSAGPNEMRWLNPVEAKKYNIAYHLRDEKDLFIVGPWPKEEPPSTPRQLPTVTVDPPKVKPKVEANTSRYCVSVVEASAEIKQDAEFDATAWLVLREGPGPQFKPAGRTGTIGKIEADAIDGEWTHLVGRGWVRTKFVQPCSRA
jgi:hypothetical protein